MILIMRYLHSFWTAGFWALLLAVLLSMVYSINGHPIDVMIATIVGIAFWIALLLTARRLIIHTDSRALDDLLSRYTAEATQVKRLPLMPDSEKQASISSFLSRAGITKRRLSFLKETYASENGPKIFDELINHVDQSVISWYVPVNALVWSLPALGFLGTAWHMRETIIIFLHEGVSANAPNAEVLSQIAPSLLISFLIISVALGLTVLTYIGTALVLRADTKALQSLKEFLTYLMFDSEEKIKHDQLT